MSRKKKNLALIKRNIKSSPAGTWMLFLPRDNTRDEGASLLEFFIMLSNIVSLALNVGPQGKVLESVNMI